MLRRMTALDPAPVFMGGYAEDAVLAGELTRPHVDFDWLFPRQELELRRAQAEQLGFSGFETWGEAAPGEPFYVFAENGDLQMGSFGELSDRHRESSRLLRERFLSDRTEAELQPLIESLRSG